MSYSKKTWENLPDTTTPVNSTGMNDLESRIEAGLKSINVLGLTTNEIVDEDDLNDFEDEGIYVYNAGSPTDSIFHTPSTRVFSPFKLLVISMPDYGNFASKIQLFISQWDTRVFIRALDYMEGSYLWHDWKEITMDEDSGLKTVTLTSDFAAYGNDSNNMPKYRKIGNIVNFRGAVTPTAQLASSTEQTICTLPGGYRPAFEVKVICQGSGMNRWLFSISKNGTVTMSRYGVSTQDNVPAGAWLPFNVTYFC